MFQNIKRKPDPSQSMYYFRDLRWQTLWQIQLILLRSLLIFPRLLLLPRKPIIKEAHYSSWRSCYWYWLRLPSASLQPQLRLQLPRLSLYHWKNVAVGAHIRVKIAFKDKSACDAKSADECYVRRCRLSLNSMSIPDAKKRDVLTSRVSVNIAHIASYALMRENSFNFKWQYFFLLSISAVDTFRLYQFYVPLSELSISTSSCWSLIHKTHTLHSSHTSANATNIHIPRVDCTCSCSSLLGLTSSSANDRTL